MKRLKPSTQYKKDIKRILNNPKKLESLLVITKMLENEEPIPEVTQNCLLKGSEDKPR